MLSTPGLCGWSCLSSSPPSMHQLLVLPLPLPREPSHTFQCPRVCPLRAAQGQGWRRFGAPSLGPPIECTYSPASCVPEALPQSAAGPGVQRAPSPVLLGRRLSTGPFAQARGSDAGASLCRETLGPRNLAKPENPEIPASAPTLQGGWLAECCFHGGTLRAPRRQVCPGPGPLGPAASASCTWTADAHPPRGN